MASSSSCIPYPVTKTIRERRSVRSYQNRPLAPETAALIEDYARQVTNPFGADVRINLIHKSLAPDGEKLGTYGVIRGASSFLTLAAAPGPHALLGAGFAFEDLILYATSLGLGTVWLAATFSHKHFRSAGEIPADFLFPAISPVGYPADKRLLERLMRKAIGSDGRKPWSDLFFDGDCATPLTPEAAGPFAEALEMVRLAPSATNAQPWRVIRADGSFHFYETHRSGTRPADVLIKQVDLGIALRHFTRTLESLSAAWTIATDDPGLPVTAEMHYVATVNPLR